MSGAAATIASGVLGAGASIFGASQAASAQTKAAKQATDAQLKMFGITREQLQPFVNAGLPAAANLGNAMTDPYFTKPIDFTQAGLEATPGYQFALSQGLKSTQSGYAARGLGSSGAAMKGAASYATGLASNTYQTMFDIERQQRDAIFNRFLQGAGLGGNAAAGVGNAAMTTGSNIANNLIGAGNAQAAAWNTAGQSVAGLGSQLGGYAYMQPYMNKLIATTK